ncbi:MAG: toprim domain-containing protein [Candidatus Paceibacterota bacterium]
MGELTKHQEAHSYVTDRGVKEDTIKHWRIGYVPGPPKNGWRHTKEALSAKGYTDTQLLHAGLIKSAGEGKAPYDVFRDRLMFPIADASGRVVAFSGRLLAKDSDAPKYVNSPETELFNKSEILFGYDKAKQGIRQLDFSLIVEGQFDVVLAHQAGYHNTVAVSGTALTAQHVSLLQRLSNRVVLALDSDRAGIAAVKRAAELMLARGMDLKVATLPAGKDPADIIKDDALQFKKYIGEAKHVIEFLLDVIEAEATNERSFKLRVRDEVLPYVVRIESHIDREHFAGVIAERLSSTQDAVMLEVARLETKVDTTPVSEPAVDTPKEVPTEDREQGLVAYLLVAADVVGAPLSKRIYEAVEEVTGDIARELKQQLPPEVVSQLVFSIEEQFATFAPKHIKEELTDRLVQLEDCVYRRNVRALKEALALAERDGDTEAVETYLKELTTWQQKHQRIGSTATFSD